MTIVEHLSELRYRLVVSVIAIAIGAVIGFLVYGRVLHFLLEPYCSLHRRKLAGCTLLTQDPLEPFIVRLKLSAWTGFALASPVVFYQLWRFVTPGLHSNEKKYAIPFVITSVVLFAMGGVVAWLTFPKALDFLVGVGGTNLTAIFSPGKYLRLIVLMILAFGLAFEFPILLIFLELAHVLSSRQLVSWWRPAVVVIFAVAAVITPSQDPYSLFAMAIPMTIFYFAAAGVGRILKR
jgi:sec-independent protein translocase protein TatC